MTIGLQRAFCFGSLVPNVDSKIRRSVFGVLLALSFFGPADSNVDHQLAFERDRQLCGLALCGSGAANEGKGSECSDSQDPSICLGLRRIFCQPLGPQSRLPVLRIGLRRAIFFGSLAPK